MNCRFCAARLEFTFLDLGYAPPSNAYLSDTDRDRPECHYPLKGNTLLNYAGVKPDLVPMVCDAAPAKQGKYLPGSHIPIVKPEMLIEMKPDIVLVLPWNIADEVAQQHAYISQWGGQFAVAVPTMKIFDPPP